MARSTKTAAITVAILLFLILAFLGGGANRIDSGIVVALAAERSNHPALTGATLALTNLGSAIATLGLSLAAAALLLMRGCRKRAVEMIAIILSGRLLVELLKLAAARPRPAFDVHPVIVHSASFPSGHAANSMISFVTIALFLAPPGRRSAALAAAIGLSLVVGATRPLLGVHWPSDVLAGWLLGLLWSLEWHSRCASSLDPPARP